MSDITKCHGLDCPVKEKCKRFTARSNDNWQAYFLEPQYDKTDTSFTCDMYWGDNAEAVWQDLKRAMGINLPE
jgi:hypothetical protein